MFLINLNKYIYIYVYIILFISLAFVGLTSYTMARSFFQVYGMTIDTIMLCYAEDADVHKDDLSQGYMGPGLRNVLHIKGPMIHSPKG